MLLRESGMLINHAMLPENVFRHAPVMLFQKAAYLFCLLIYLLLSKCFWTASQRNLYQNGLQQAIHLKWWIKTFLLLSTSFSVVSVGSHHASITSRYKYKDFKPHTYAIQELDMRKGQNSSLI